MRRERDKIQSAHAPYKNEIYEYEFPEMAIPFAPAYEAYPFGKFPSPNGNLINRLAKRGKIRQNLANVRN